MPGVPHVGWEGPSAVAGLSTVGMLDSGGGFPHCWLHGLVGHEAAAGPLVVSLVLTAAAWAAQGGDGEHAGLVPAYLLQGAVRCPRSCLHVLGGQGA